MLYLILQIINNILMNDELIYPLNIDHPNLIDVLTLNLFFFILFKKN